MKKLNRRKLRSILLNELAIINEETGPEALRKFMHKQDAEYERAAKQDGIIGVAFSMLIGLPLEGMIAASKLLADDNFRAELESKYDNEGFEQAYVFWLNSLSDATGL
jgi:hypothetical protein